MNDNGYAHGRSGSLANREYWWYRARRELFLTVFAPLVDPGSRILEIGSADGPSVEWLASLGDRIATDLDPTGLAPGDVCASATALPFPAATFDVVGAFDVVEHVPDEATVFAELRRILRPGGVLLISVPAYQWAWTELDDLAGHHRRYTRPRLTRAATDADFEVIRSTHAFAASFPFFAADRLRARVTGRSPERPADSKLPARAEELLSRLAAWDRNRLARHDLPFGSSILLAARAAGTT